MNLDEQLGGAGGGGMGMPFPGGNPFDAFGGNPFEGMFGGGGGGDQFGGPGAGAAVPGNPISNARQAARNSQSRNNLKNMMLALHNYHDTFKWFPLPKSAPPDQRDADGKPLLSWRVHLLPWLEQKQLYEQFHLDEPWDSPHNKPLIDQMPKVFKSPLANTKPGQTVYLAVDGKDTIYEGGKGNGFRDVIDGTSNTIMIVEVKGDRAVPWTKPEDYEYDPAAPAKGLLIDRGTFNAALCDSQVLAIDGKIDPKVLNLLFQRNDKQPIPPGVLR